MQTVRQLDALRGAVATWRAAGERVALVPTMGALHDGHMALVEAARRAAQRVVVSIFVNPKQFGPNEDLAKYPRKELADTRMLTAAGVDLLWLPPVEVIYPEGFATNISISGISEVLDGAHRPGHFDGVATVVAKLFNQVRPDIALFGEKDWQQLAVIRRLTTDLDLDIEIQGVPTQREDDGLALSSRNAYLIPEERAQAVALPRALGLAERTIAKGGDPEAALAQARETLIAAGFEVDYVVLADAETLSEPIEGRAMRLLAAARLGGTRLIDNIPVAMAE
ncbi:pantoate--beta-alanine ligase [Sphingomonas sp. DG1-23]|uniref:pantoate--beta-alanine ligase n=1 Tax=Sphingomonas sp. DG1-23 TaxID=3068316 RepID=UPI00273DF821|nr:pantoate--beta-alanine ligase [Sphingomonas sp. DG1-23]MDP5280906.1 pantoate--beta-alanine ligase [Sphingomonas sp. DG1-23]